MKTLIKIVIGIFGVIVLAIAAVFFFTSDMTKTADEFLALARNDSKAAYAYLSEDFRAGTSFEEFSSFIKTSALDKYESSSWESRSRNGNRGTLKGSITTVSGGVIPLTLNLVKGNGSWKVYSIQKPSSGIQIESENGELPTQKEQVVLVDRAMQEFANSVNNKSMASFHDFISEFWQKQVSVESLDKAFEPFFGAVDLTVLKSYEPQFSKDSQITEDGILILAGSYPTKPNKVYFEQKYIYEGLGWKLVGFSTDIK
ncbi:hypothetical protein [Microbulbifer hainanensis]|uniref:hypothetical protein n=1 Tax=Microbulbifer hainanensis TaxID=2735675 RepID=UPI001868634C|nr:hypothetical protein [Microbulbifer hainanensis]